MRHPTSTARNRPSRASLVLVLATTLSMVLAACGGDGGSAEEPTGGGTPAADLDDDQVATMEEIGLDASQPYAGTELSFLLCCQTAAQFATIIEKTPEFTEMTGIEVEFVDVDFASFQQRLTASVVTGETDLVAWVDAWGPSIRGSLVPLDDRLAEVGRSIDEYPAPYGDVVAAGSEGGETLGLPLRGHPFMSFYRTDVLDEVGMEVPTTWQEARQLSEVTSAETDVPGTAKYYGNASGQNIFEWVSRVWSNGGDIFDDGGQPVVNSPEAVEATTDYVDYLEAGLTPPGAVNWNESEALTEFVEGRAGAFNGWWWMYGNMINPDIATDAVLDQVTFAPAPAYEGGSSVTYTYLWPMGISNQSPNVDAAFEYLNWVSHPTVGLEVVMESQDPGGAVHLATQQDAEANEVFDGLLETGGQILQEGRALPMIPQWPEVQNILGVAINDIAGGADVQSRLDQANEEIADAIG